MDIEQIKSGIADININPFPILHCMMNFDLRYNRVTTFTHTIKLPVKTEHIYNMVGGRCWNICRKKWHQS